MATMAPNTDAPSVKTLSFKLKNLNEQNLNEPISIKSRSGSAKNDTVKLHFKNQTSDSDSDSM